MVLALFKHWQERFCVTFSFMICSMFVYLLMFYRCSGSPWKNNTTQNVTPDVLHGTRDSKNKTKQQEKLVHVFKVPL